MLKKFLLFYTSIILLTASPTSHCSEQKNSNNIKKHVEFLSADQLQGRLTGTTGEKIATQYVADVFHQLGLVPAGDNGTYFQIFHFTAGVLFGKKNACTLITKKGENKQLILGQTWQPLPFSDNNVFHITELILAGYGITAPAKGKLPAYDSYQNLNVKNKWVVVFRNLPTNITLEKNQQLNPYASLRYKAFTAKEHSAKGIIFVNGTNTQKQEWLPVAFDTSVGSGIAAISVTDNVMNDLLLPFHYSLQTLKNSLDTGKSLPLTHITPVQITGEIDIAPRIQTGRNVLGKLEQGGNPMIVIGAHVDHLGHGEFSGSLANKNERGLIHNGADDNASGVASLLEVARLLTNETAKGKRLGNKDILFAAWSGEELGILGSSHFVKSARKKTQFALHAQIDANLNVDMVGHLRGKLVLQGTGSSKAWPELIAQLPIHQHAILITQTDPYLPTDSTVFYLQGVPILNFFTGAHESYHTPRDKAESINYSGVKTIADILTEIVLRLEQKPHAIPFCKIRKIAHESSGGMRVYLGTIPDYASTENIGVTLSGVKKDSPAEQANLQENDVIIELAGKKMNNIYDYSYRLNALPIGKPVSMVVLRNHKKLSLTIVAESKE